MEPNLSVRDDAVSWTPTDDGQVVILDLRSSRYLSLNASAGRLWTLLAGGAARPDLVAELTTSYGLPAPDAERDVDAFLAGLLDRKLIERSSAS